MRVYAIADDHFILTASHGLRDIVEHNIQLFVARPDFSGSPVPLCSATFHTTEVESRDVAAIRLTADDADGIAEFRSFLRHDKVDLYEAGPDGLYVVFGHPHAWFGPKLGGKLSSTPLPYLCRPYTGTPLEDSIYDSKIHTILGFDRDALDALDRSKRELPTPCGMSGCGIRRVGDLTANGLATWSPEQFRLVAIQHRSPPSDGYVMGTRIRYPLGLVLDNYPGLRGSINLIYPQR